MSRRGALTAVLSVASAGTVLALGAASRAADVSSQLRKEDVRYQDQPKGNQRCAGCKNFVQPGACRVVSGSVNPSGWCLLFQAAAS